MSPDTLVASNELKGAGDKDRTGVAELSVEDWLNVRVRESRPRPCVVVPPDAACPKPRQQVFCANHLVAYLGHCLCLHHDHYERPCHFVVAGAGRDPALHSLVVHLELLHVLRRLVVHEMSLEPRKESKTCLAIL